MVTEEAHLNGAGVTDTYIMTVTPMVYADHPTEAQVVIEYTGNHADVTTMVLGVPGGHMNKDNTLKSETHMNANLVMTMVSGTGDGTTTHQSVRVTCEVVRMSKDDAC